MSKRELPTGTRFGKLTVLCEAAPYVLPCGAIQRGILCRCDCGQLSRPRVQHLIDGLSKSCGCGRIAATRRDKFRHGESVNRTPEYRCWKGVIERCSKPRYKNYYGRGITVCDRWRDGEGGLTGYQCFLADMGRKPTPKHSIERENNNGNYEPTNCSWATRSQQSRNKRLPPRLGGGWVSAAHENVSIAVVAILGEAA